jgi:hypothetical protein
MKARLVILFLAALLLPLACDGNGGRAPSADETPADQTTPSGDVTPPAGGTPTDDGVGDDIDRVALEEYFRTIDALQEEGASAVAEASREFDIAIREEESDERVIETLREFVTAIVVVTRSFLEELRSVAVPSEVEDEHNELLTAEVALLEALEDFLERPPNTQSASETMEELFGESSEITALAVRESEACDALQAVATAEGIDVNVCESEPE